MLKCEHIVCVPHAFGGPGDIDISALHVNEIRDPQTPVQPTFLIRPHHHNACDHHNYQKGKNYHSRGREERCTTHLGLGKMPAVSRCLAFVSEVRYEGENLEYHDEHPYRIEPVSKSYLNTGSRAYQSSIRIFRHVSG